MVQRRWDPMPRRAQLGRRQARRHLSPHGSSQVMLVRAAWASVVLDLNPATSSGTMCARPLIPQEDTRVHPGQKKHGRGQRVLNKKSHANMAPTQKPGDTPFTTALGQQMAKSCGVHKWGADHEKPMRI